MDSQTLCAVDLIVFSMCSLALLMNMLGVKSVRIPTSLLLCSLSGALGMLLLVFHGKINYNFAAVMGTFFAELSFVFMYFGYSSMTQMPKRSLTMQAWKPMLGIVIASTVAMAYCMTSLQAILPRVVLFSGTMVIVTATCMLLLLRVPDVFLREASWLTILCLGLSTLTNSMRLIEALVNPPTVPVLSGGVPMAYAMVNMIALAGLTYGHIWITGARQRMVLQAQAHTDELTGVLNRRALEVEAEREISRSRRSGEPLAVMMCDLDNFKTANDVLGHQYGDALLQAAAQTLRDTLRREDLIARMGGDEFVVLLPGAGPERAMEVAERLRGEIERLRVVEQGKSMALQASFGIAMLDSVLRDDWELLLERADSALYAAKRVGGNHIMMDPVPVHLRGEMDIMDETNDLPPAIRKRVTHVLPGSTTIH
jgi:diguanylate cyclase (GGDEF)-like protein